MFFVLKTSKRDYPFTSKDWGAHDNCLLLCVIAQLTLMGCKLDPFYLQGYEVNDEWTKQKEEHCHSIRKQMGEWWDGLPVEDKVVLAKNMLTRMQQNLKESHSLPLTPEDRKRKYAGLSKEEAVEQRRKDLQLKERERDVDLVKQVTEQMGQNNTWLGPEFVFKFMLYRISKQPELDPNDFGFFVIKNKSIFREVDKEEVEIFEDDCFDISQGLVNHLSDVPPKYMIRLVYVYKIHYTTFEMEPGDFQQLYREWVEDAKKNRVETSTQKPIDLTDD